MSLFAAMLGWYGCSGLARRAGMRRALVAAMASGDKQPSIPPAELRPQEAECYQTLTAVLAGMPRGTTVEAALASDAGERRTKVDAQIRPQAPAIARSLARLTPGLGWTSEPAAPAPLWRQPAAVGRVGRPGTAADPTYLPTDPFRIGVGGS